MSPADHFARFMAIKVRELAPLVRSGTLTLDEAWLAATGGMSTEDSDGAQARRDFDAAIAEAMIPAILIPILDSVSLAPSEREAIAAHPGVAYDITIDLCAALRLRDRLRAIPDSTQLRALEACVRVLLDTGRNRRLTCGSNIGGSGPYLACGEVATVYRIHGAPYEDGGTCCYCSAHDYECGAAISEEEARARRSAAGRANCGCVYHAEDGEPCEHDRALAGRVAREEPRALDGMGHDDLDSPCAAVLDGIVNGMVGKWIEGAK